MDSQGVEQKTQNLNANIDLRKLSPSQLLLGIGALVTIAAGITFISTSWSVWTPIARILSVFIPMLIMYLVGIPMWYNPNYKKFSIIFIITGGFLFPLFMWVFLRQLNIFTDINTDFGLTISITSFVIYLICNFVFRFSFWPFLYILAGLSSYMLFISKIIDTHSEYRLFLWLQLVPVIVLVLLGLYYEKTSKRDFARIPYIYGFMLFIVTLYSLAATGSFFQFLHPSQPTQNDSFYSYALGSTNQIGFSHIFISIIFLLVSYSLSKIKTIFIEAGKFEGLFNFFGTYGALSSIFKLSLGGAKPFYETSLLFFSLGFIFVSIVRHSRSFLYFGALFLMIYIFDIGGEYFKDQIGWPLTLFVAGLLAMAAGIGLEQIRRRYFPKTTTPTSIPNPTL